MNVETAGASRRGIVLKALREVADYIKDGRLAPVLPDYPP